MNCKEYKLVTNYMAHRLVTNYKEYRPVRNYKEYVINLSQIIRNIGLSKIIIEY